MMWQPIETAPTGMNDQIDLWVQVGEPKHSFRATDSYFYKGVWWGYNPDQLDDVIRLDKPGMKITHWMPLPQPPNG